MCKDQHGCRFLQKKLEEQNPRVTEMIFKEVFTRIVELMTGMPFLLAYSVASRIVGFPWRCSYELRQILSETTCARNFWSTATTCNGSQ